MITRKVLSALIMSITLTIGIISYEWFRTSKHQLVFTLEDMFWLLVIIIIYVYPITFCYSILISTTCEHLFHTTLSLYSLFIHLFSGIFFMFLAALYYNPFFFFKNFSTFLIESSGYILISIICSFLYWIIDCYLYIFKNKQVTIKLRNL